MTDTPLPYGRQQIDDDDVAAVVAALRSDWLTGGPEVSAFENAFAECVGAPYAVACSSGTAALHIAAMALGIEPGDKVVVPAVTFLASANAFRFEGADIIFADVDPRTGLMTSDTLKQCLSDRAGGKVAAIVPVHLGGRCESPALIAETAAQHGAAVVEDACHALGTRYETNGHFHRVGSAVHSDIAIFSLHPVKTITMGEGGVATTRNEELANAMQVARNHGTTRDPASFQNAAQAFDAGGQPNQWYYEAHGIAPNYRASDIHCALGRSQLTKLATFAENRKRLAKRYDALLAGLGPEIQPVGAVHGCDPVLHLYGVHIDFSALETDRNAVMRDLSKRGIGTQVHYIPLHMQPYYRRLNPELSLPGAERYYDSILSLPLFPAMTEDDQKRVVDALHDIIHRHTKASVQP